MNIVSWDSHLNFWMTHSHLKQKLIQIHIFRSHSISSRIIFDQIEFYFDHSQHSRFQHLFQQDSFLWVHDLIVAIFKGLVALHILDIEVGIKFHPFFIVPFILHLYWNIEVPLYHWDFRQEDQTTHECFPADRWLPLSTYCCSKHWTSMTCEGLSD